MTTFYAIAADLMLFAHLLLVAFVVLGLFLVYVGRALAWSWVRNPWLRIVHLLAIAIVVAQAWLGLVCPLTTWEMKLRHLAGQTAYEGSFVTHWLSTLLYYDAPASVFTAVYTVFGTLVLMSWIIARPRPFKSSRAPQQSA